MQYSFTDEDREPLKMCHGVQCNNKVADRINPKAQSLPKSKCLWAYAGDVNGFTKATEKKKLVPASNVDTYKLFSCGLASMIYIGYKRDTEKM